MCACQNDVAGGGRRWRRGRSPEEVAVAEGGGRVASAFGARGIQLERAPGPPPAGHAADRASRRRAEGRHHALEEGAPGAAERLAAVADDTISRGPYAG